LQPLTSMHVWLGVQGGSQVFTMQSAPVDVMLPVPVEPAVPVPVAAVEELVVPVVPFPVLEPLAPPIPPPPLVVTVAPDPLVGVNVGGFRDGSSQAAPAANARPRPRKVNAACFIMGSSDRSEGLTDRPTSRDEDARNR
jgi:hypothetical protein